MHLSMHGNIRLNDLNGPLQITLTVTISFSASIYNKRYISLVNVLSIQLTNRMA